MINHADQFKAYTLEEVANMLKVDKRIVKKEIDQNKLKAVRVGKQYRIMHEHLSDYTGTAKFNEVKSEISNAGAATLTIK